MDAEERRNRIEPADGEQAQELQGVDEPGKDDHGPDNRSDFPFGSRLCSSDLDVGARPASSFSLSFYCNRRRDAILHFRQQIHARSRRANAHN